MLTARQLGAARGKDVGQTPGEDIYLTDLLFINIYPEGRMLYNFI